ncbi:MAG TPA: hypothetical protein VN442_09605 [Bryobacteraceae bacterium]|nr:hypothetical protein [Bryobacteraceae bacterium]
MAAVLIILLVLFAWDRRIALFLKSRVTFPRTGYVRPPVVLDGGSYDNPIGLGLTSYQAPPDENVTVFRIASRVVLVFGWALAQGIARPVGIPVALALVAILLYLFNRKGEHPYHWTSLLLLPLAGLVAVPFSPPGGEIDGQITLAIEGAWLAARGTWPLTRYLRAHPRPQPLAGLHS